MPQIVLDTDQAEFRFEAQSVIKHLLLLRQNFNRTDLQRCIDEISTHKAAEIKVQSSPSWFFPIAIELLQQGKSQIFCKSCGQAYEPGSLSLFPIGFGKSPFDVTGVPHDSFFKRLFQRKRRVPGMFGGKGFRCPAGHELISVMTWIT